MKVNAFIKDSVVKLNPYIINKTGPGISVKLDANESNYALPESLAREYMDFIKDTRVNLYPESDCGELYRLLERFFGIGADNFIFGNGSDELILTILLSLKKDIIVNVPEPSFSMYGIIAGYNDFNVNYIRLTPESFDLPSINERDSQAGNIYFLSCPNNPTGNYFNPETIKSLLLKENNIVVIDEAYVDFSDRETYIKSLIDYPNLIVLRTFSKIGMAGLRFGMLFAGDALISEFRKVKLPFNVNVLTLKSMEFFLSNFSYFKANIEKTIAERKSLCVELSKFNFLKPYPSEANFILVELADKQNFSRFDSFLKKNGIIIRSFGGNMSGFFRISVGDSYENLKLIESIKQFKP